MDTLVSGWFFFKCNQLYEWTLFTHSPADRQQRLSKAGMYYKKKSHDYWHMSLYAHLFSSPCLGSLGIQGFESNFLKTFPLPVMFASVPLSSTPIWNYSLKSEHFPSKHKALCLIPNTTREEKRREEPRGRQKGQLVHMLYTWHGFSL